MFCRSSVYIVQIMFLNELYYNKFYHLLVYFLTCCLCSNFNNFISCFKGFSGSIFLSTPKAAVRSAVYMLSATRLLSPSVAQVVAQGVYISILYTEWNQSCATGICWYYRSNGKWTLKVALKWCPYAHNLKLALYTRIGLPGASSTSNFVQLASGSAYMFVPPKYH